MDSFLAALPILVVLVVMLGLRWSGSRSGPLAWLAAILVAGLRFGAGWQILAWAQLKGLLLALWVLYIIWAALLLFRIADEAGATAAIGESLSRLTSDRALQALLLGWILATFLQGFAGFGVPIAAIAPLLVTAGFTPVTSVLIASVGSAWGVTYGTLGAAFYALLAASGYPGEELAVPLALMMGLACLFSGFAILWAAVGPRGLRRATPFWLLTGLVMAGVQVVTAWAGLWTIGVFCAGLAGLGVGVAAARRWAPAAPAPVPSAPGSRLSLAWALAPYGVLVAVVLARDMVPSVAAFLGQVVLHIQTPALSTSQGWTVSAGASQSIDLLGSPGALLLYVSILTFGMYRRRGFYRPEAARRIGTKVLRQAVPTSIAIVTMMAMATTMQDAGMTYLLARGLSQVAGPVFPPLSIWLGAFGAFMTGSNANSAVILSGLQEQAALLVNMSPVLALVAQGLGGALGGIFAPAKVILGCAAVGADEGTTMRRTMAYGLAIIAALGLVIWIVHLVGQ